MATGPILDVSTAKVGTSHGFIYAWLDVLASYVQLTTYLVSYAWL